MDMVHIQARDARENHVNIIHAGFLFSLLWGY